jgi:hypothetical protein
VFRAPERLIYAMTRIERETVVRWDEEGDVVWVWSASPKVWRRMARFGIKPIGETTMDGRPSGKFYRAPMAWLRWSVRERVAGRGNPEALARMRAARS